MSKENKVGYMYSAGWTSEKSRKYPAWYICHFSAKSTLGAKVIKKKKIRLNRFHWTAFGF